MINSRGGIIAPANGTVIFANYTSENGNVLIIQHKNNYLSIFKHCSVLLKRERETIIQGEPIAISGNTGTNTSGEEAVLQADMPRGMSIVDMAEDTLSTVTEILGEITFPDGDGSETHTVRIEFAATDLTEAPIYIEDGEIHNFTLADGKYFANINGDNVDTTQIRMPTNFNGYIEANVTLIAIEADVDLLANGDIDTSSAGYYEHSHTVSFNVSAVDDVSVFTDDTNTINELAGDSIIANNVTGNVFLNDFDIDSPL